MLKLSKPVFAVLSVATIFFLLGGVVLAAPLFCVDPGHGGRDPGAKSSDFKIYTQTGLIEFRLTPGTTGTAALAGFVEGETNPFTRLPNRVNPKTGNLRLFEKDANLDISLRLKSLLDAAGYSSIMTRDSDIYLTLQERCDIANNAGTKIFVSIHNNSVLNNSTAKGTETYNFPGSSIGKLLATCIQEEVVKEVATLDRGVKEKSFFVLTYTNMPAALIECAFVSNTENLKLLLTPDFRQKLAQGIFKGLERYILTSLPRISGANRYATAACISKEGWATSSTVILARGDDFPDALAGAPLAYKFNCPILLTNSTFLSAETEAEIQRLGATEVVILGGTGAISSAVEKKLTNMGLKRRRIAGKNRFETASLIAKEIGSSSQTAVIASGLNFPDALAISSYAAKIGAPILLSRETTLTAETISTLASLGITNTIVVGGTGVISPSVETYLSQNGHNPVRIGGANRFETSALIAYTYFQSPSIAYVATGTDFPDALAAAPLAAKRNAPLVLVEKEKLPASVSDYIRAYAANLQGVYLLGGEGPISAEVARRICAILYF